MKGYSSWTQREQTSLGLAVIAFVYAGAKLWIRHHPSESLVPALVGLVFAIWLLGQIVFENRPAFRRASIITSIVLAGLSGYLVFRFPL